jgi:predicted transcriptional regulator
VFDRAREQLTIESAADEAVRSFESIADVRQLLTDRRVEAMRAIMTEPPKSISALAERLERNYADVHADVQVLADHHIVYFDTDGRSKRPVIPYDRVHLDIEVSGDATSDHAFA